MSTKRAIVTGCAGFIGSHLVDSLLDDGWTVDGIDDMSLGVIDRPRQGFRLHRESIQRLGATGRLAPLVEESHAIFHLAAHGSVPKSLRHPMLTFDNNVTAFVYLLESIRAAPNRPRLVFASSSSVYGDCPSVMKREDERGRPLSPYAASKQIMETYASAYANSYGIQSVGLRYFNVFGPRQRADSAYSAVIPKWAAAMIRGDEITINGDGHHQRDFTPVGDVVQATRNAASVLFTTHQEWQFINVGRGKLTSLRSLFGQLAQIVGYELRPVFVSPRPGDVVASGADISLMRDTLGTGTDQSFDDALKSVVASQRLGDEWVSLPSRTLA